MDRDFLIDLFSDFGPVTIRPMFSGFGISADGINFALALRAGLYFRADEQTIPPVRGGRVDAVPVSDAGQDRHGQLVLAVAGPAVRRSGRADGLGEGGIGGGATRGAAQAAEGAEDSEGSCKRSGGEKARRKEEADEESQKERAQKEVLILKERAARASRRTAARASDGAARLLTMGQDLEVTLPGCGSRRRIPGRLRR